GENVGVLNFPVRSGYAINGFVVPGMLSDSPPTYPAGLRTELEAATRTPHVPELPPYREADRKRWIDLATRAIEQYGRYAEILCERYRPSFLFTLLRETDRVEHQHWAELTRPIERVGEDLKRFWRAVDATCARIDAAFRSVGGPTLTFVISDHGHGLARSDFFTNRWLAREGFLTFKRPEMGWHRRWAARALLASERYAPTRWLVRAAADRLRGGSGRAWVGKVLAGEGSFESMAENIDWDRTVAFSYPVPEGIYINRYHPNLSAEAAAKAVSEIRRRLEACPDAHIEVFEPRDLYKGKNLGQAPALLLRIDDLATEPRMDFSYPEPMLRDRPGYFYGSGVHRMEGILLVAGDGVAPGRSGGPVSLLDVAPTILESMGYPPGPGMVGRSFGAALSPAAPRAG
ncbi:MAG TPA: alkaline phosphatase family protein, partial [Thermoplasmata archaeon]|nr:alkaline phosphatase family protein [Thermoplasmata archaeon]